MEKQPRLSPSMRNSLAVSKTAYLRQIQFDSSFDFENELEYLKQKMNAAYILHELELSFYYEDLIS